ncbi:hypothetical protein MMC18_003791 [Xylographa bjoerkii]|nr:hypothetical protein [Xylographa bjoerkii]
MVLLNGLTVMVSLASIAICSPLDTEASSGAVGVSPALGLPAIPAVAPLDHALAPGGLPHMPADLATGQLVPHHQKSENHNGQVAIGKLGNNKGIKAGHNVHSHAEHQHFDAGQNHLQLHHHVKQQVADLSLPTTEEKALAASPPPPKLAIREVIERGIANIGSRSDPPAQSFIQALGNMFSGLGNEKSKRDAPPALPAPPGPAPGAANASTPPNNLNPAAGVPPQSKDASPPPPAPAVPAPAPAEAAAPPPPPQSPPGSPPPAPPAANPPNGSPPPPPPANPNPAPADLAAVSPPVADSPPPQGPPAPPATPADAAVPPAAQASPASNANSPSNPPAAPPAVDIGASSPPPAAGLKALPGPESVPASPGAVAQNGHMGQLGPQSGIVGAQQHRANYHRAYTKGAHEMGSHHRGGHRKSGHRASHHRQHHGTNPYRLNYYGSNHYGTHRSAINGMKSPGLKHAGITRYGSHNIMQTGMQQGVPSTAGDLAGVPSDFQASPTAGPPVSASMTGSGPKQAIQRRHYRNRRSIDFTSLPRSRRTVQSRDHVYYRRDESSASARASNTQAEKTTSALETPGDDKPVASDNTAKSKPKDKSDTEAAEKTVDSKASDQSKDDIPDKGADSKASEKSKADTADKAADAKPAPKSDASEASTESKVPAKDSKNMGSMPIGLDSSLTMGGAKDAAPKKHNHDASEAHTKGGKGHHGANEHSKGRKTKVPVYKPRPKGQRTKPKSKKPSVSDHHSSHYNPHHKMIPQIARRHELQVRNAAAEADALADAYTNYLQKRDVYAEYLAKREAYAYPEAWACSGPSGCN